MIVRNRPGRWKATVVYATMLLWLTGCALVPPRVAHEALPAHTEPPAIDEKHVRISIRDEDFILEIADNDDLRAKGLSGRSSIPKHGGMIFIYPAPAHRSFWMFGCLVPIDIAFLDADGRIVAMHEMPVDPPRRPDEDAWEYEARLNRYPSRRPAQFALEFRAGTLDRLALKVGDRIAFDRAPLIERAIRNARDADW